MSSKSDKDEDNIMQSLTGVRLFQNDKVDLYHITPRKKHFIRSHQGFDQLSTTFQSISHNVPSSVKESWYHHGIQKKLRRKIKAGQLNIDGLLDLHGHTQHQATQELESFMLYAINSQARFLLIIHGKGFNSQSEAVLRPLVQHWLSEQNMVLAYCPAQPKDGGSGASYAYLKSQ